MSDKPTEEELVQRLEQEQSATIRHEYSTHEVVVVREEDARTFRGETRLQALEGAMEYFEQTSQEDEGE